MSETLASETPGAETPASGRTTGNRVLKMTALSCGFVALILFFTILKMPKARVTDLIQGYIQTALDPAGIYIRSRDRTLGFFPSLRYRLDHPVIELSEQTQIELDDLEVRPALLKLLTGSVGGVATLHQGKGDLLLNAGLRKNSVSIEAVMTELDLGKIGAFSFAGIKGGGSLNGRVDLNGAPADFTAMNGTIDFKLKGVNLEEQTLYGFKIPPVLLSDGNITADLRSGKLSLKNVALGRQNDDLSLTASGDVTLNRNLNSSLLNLRITLSLSEKLKAAFSFIDMMLSGSKQKDGRYAFKLTGPLAQPTLVPETSN
jgi:type II secretion system protein N